jgi:phage terminase small subunit
LDEKAIKSRIKLTEKQRRFVEFYLGAAKGNGTKAARLAGYKGKATTLGQVAQENLKKPLVADAINRSIKKKRTIANKEDLLEFWTYMIEHAEDSKDQIKCSELLAKAYAMFVQKHEVKSEVTVDDRRTKLQEQLQDSSIWSEIEKLDSTLEA